MNMARFIRVTKTLANKGKLFTEQEFNEFITTKKDVDFYYSTFYYNDKHKEIFDKTGSVSGITDVTGDTLYFDFDNQDFEKVRSETKTLISRFKKENIKDTSYKVLFSGKKGTHVQLKLDKEYTPKQLEHLALNYYGKGLTSLDPRIYNPSRVLRLPYSKHQDTSVYKQELTNQQLDSSSIIDIQTQFKQDCIVKPIELTPITINEANLPKEKIKVNKELTPVTEKPKHWIDYKWSMLNADKMVEGERDHAMMVLGATCRGLGYNKEITASFLTYFDERYAAVTNQDTNEEQVEAKLDTVFKETWNGGTYTYKNDPWIREYCKRIGVVDAKDEFKTKKVNDLLKDFESFSLDFENNILRTGIKEIDDNILFLSGTHNGILGQPGSAKTTILLRWMANLSKDGIHSMFYSLDMAEEAIYAKLVQFVTGYDFDKCVKLRKIDPVSFKKVSDQINEMFKHVEFNFTSGTSVTDIKQHVLDYEQATGNKIKFLGVDYLECLQGPYQDSTANVGFISQQLKDLAKDIKLCSVILLQTQKHGGEVSEPLLSMKRIKGSSVIEQSATVVLTLWREGYDPRYQNDDKYISFAAVKNRFGKLWSDDFHWNGAKGDITPLTDEQRDNLDKLRQQKKKDKNAEIKAGWDN